MRNGIVGCDKLRWKRDNVGFHLFRGRRPEPLISVVPDRNYPGMFRLDFGDGSISDVLNLSRAIDAARAIALAQLNHYEGQERPSKGGLIAQNKKGVSLPLADQIQRASEEATNSRPL